jgi:hypothetical protein
LPIFIFLLRIWTGAYKGWCPQVELDVGHVEVQDTFAISLKSSDCSPGKTLSPPIQIEQLTLIQSSPVVYLVPALVAPHPHPSTYLQSSSCSKTAHFPFPTLHICNDGFTNYQAQFWTPYATGWLWSMESGQCHLCRHSIQCYQSRIPAVRWSLR